jgi:adenine-specific DNA-methyltransferase
MKKSPTKDPEIGSVDAVSENVAQLSALFPDVVADGVVNLDALTELLGCGGANDNGHERYGLNWFGKRRARRLALTPSMGTLRPAPAESVDWNSTQNLMIEGDNLEVLKLLQKSYAGRVSFIYIDPPYNTGQDFVYRDDFHNNIKQYLELTGQVEGGRIITSNSEQSGRFHTDWLNMMYPRLKLARNLMSADGVLCASIDDSESANLKHILDELFGADNFIDTIAVEMSTTSGPKTVNAQRGTIVKNLEFVHIYRKSAEFDARPHVPLLDGIESYDTHYSVWLNEDGTLGTLAEKLLADQRVEADVRKYGLADGDKFSLNSLDSLLRVSKTARAFIEANLKRIASVDRPPVSAVGRSTPVGRWEPFQADHRTYFLTTLGNGTLRGLMPLSLNYRMSDDYKPKFGRTVIRGDLWKGFHQDMGNVAKEGGVAFPSGKKPLRLIKQLIKWADNTKDSLVLDFFAGSGTTAHAVMQLNAEDNSNRRFILVQLPESLDPELGEQKAASDLCDTIGRPRNIAELTKERLRRSGVLVNETAGVATGDVGFRVFKLATSNIHEWAPDRDDLPRTLQDAVEHLRQDRSQEDILYELLLKLGLDLRVPIEAKTIAGCNVYSIGGGALFACLADEIGIGAVEPLGLGIVAWHRALAPAGDTTCVFRDGGFVDDITKTNLAAILQQHGLQTVRSL